MQNPLVSRKAWMALSSAVGVLAGCAGSGGGGSTSDEEARRDGAPKALVQSCQWIRHEPVPKRRLLEEFADPSSGEVRLLLSDPVVRPGQILSVAVVNNSTTDVSFGESSHIEDSNSHPVRIRGPYFFRDILLFAEAGGVGPCVSLPVPSDTPAGDYTAVLDDVDKNPDDRDRGKGRTEIRTDFEVAGPPIVNPQWERQLRRAARSNRRK